MIFFLVFAQNIECGHTIELPDRDGSKEYPKSMFLNKNTRVTPMYLNLLYI